MFKCDSFDWTNLSNLRKSYSCIDDPMATKKFNPKSDMESTSAPRFLKYSIAFAIRVSQNSIFLSKPAEITWPTVTIKKGISNTKGVIDWMIQHAFLMSHNQATHLTNTVALYIPRNGIKHNKSYINARESMYTNTSLRNQKRKMTYSTLKIT